MGEIKKALKQLKIDAYEEYMKEDNPTKEESISYFGRCILYSSELIFKEKEIITFAILQLVCIGLGYYLWAQILDWTPIEVWMLAENNKSSFADLVFLLWSFICVGLTVYPLGLLTACMGAAHFLHENGKESTIAKCFRIVLPQALPLWIFSWIDGWWTVKRILYRISERQKRDGRIYLLFPAQRLIDEAFYQAWKIASLGFLPALIIGRGVKNSCKDSLGVLKTHFKYICQLRIAYSVICWILGIGACIGAIFMRPYVVSHMSSKYDVYNFYICIGIPILVALFFIQVFLRPIYILSACRIYSDYVRKNNISVFLPTVSKFSNTIIAFLVLAVIVGIAFLYKDAITQLLLFLSTFQTE